MKPLEKIQLKNWRDYLDMEIQIGSHERTVVLFERCLVACALYEEFWVKVVFMTYFLLEGVILLNKTNPLHI